MRVTSETRMKTACFVFAADSVVEICFISRAILSLLMIVASVPKSSRDLGQGSLS